MTRQSDIDDLEMALGNRDRDARDLEQALGNREQDLRDLERALGNRERDVRELEQALGSGEQALRDLEAALGTRQQDIQDLIRAIGESSKPNDLKVLEQLSIGALQRLHRAIQQALAHDDALPPGTPPRYGARTFPDWRLQADAIERELDRRGVQYVKIGW